ncbi:Methyltransferase [Candidatus Zixiibacteriota bacterium]|nr:Methyltransferase [candidate division Zixibacteria bacterium]
MDIWKFYGITHKKHLVCNPTSEAKLVHLVKILNLPKGAGVVDIACGKGEFLIRLAEQYEVRGFGVDISPYCIEDCKKKAADRLFKPNIEFTKMDGADFRPEQPASLQMAACIGASWVFKGHNETLETLKSWVVPGGLVIVGEPFWLRDPSQEYLDASGSQKGDFGTHADNVKAGEKQGLQLVYTIVSDKNDWDQYEGLQWLAADEYARQNPDDPDITELMNRVTSDKDIYLKWGRDTIGWAIYIFRRNE